MQTYIALFRGINVLGTHLLPMRELKLVLEKNGCVDVQTYIQSGNAIFRSSVSDAARVAKRLTTAVSKSHGFFLAGPPKKPDLESIEALKARTERFALKGRIFYLHTPDGFGTSKLAARAERLLGVEATARNWRTVTTLLEMVKAAGLHHLDRQR